MQAIEITMETIGGTFGYWADGEWHTKGAEAKAFIVEDPTPKRTLEDFAGFSI